MRSPGSGLSVLAMRIRGRLKRPRAQGAPATATEGDYVEIDASELSGVFAAPGWLRDIGLTAWLLVGVALFLVGAVWLLSLTQTIVMPRDHGGRGRGRRLAARRVDAPPPHPAHGGRRPGHARARRRGRGPVRDRDRRDHQRVVLDQRPALRRQGHARRLARGRRRGPDARPTNAKNEASDSVNAAGSAPARGSGHGISALSGLAFFLALTILSLFFLLSDGPKIRAWGERHLGVPLPVAPRHHRARCSARCAATSSASRSSPRFNAVVVTIGALILGVPLAGTIAAVTFLGGFIPYLGAWTAAGLLGPPRPRRRWHRRRRRR